MSNQLLLLEKNKRFYKAFGGALLKNSHAKQRRPISVKEPMHLVVRSSQAKGEYSFRFGKNYGRVDQLVRRICRKHGVRLYEYANVGNHLHLLIRLHKAFLWKAFIRELTGSLATLVRGFQKRASPFFDQRPFTRIVNGWHRAYSVMKNYIVLNQLEALGLITRVSKVQASNSG